MLCGVAAAEEPVMDVSTVENFAGLALHCIHQEYPNKIGHVMSSDDDVAPPRQLTPAFYGCFDWHSSVHGHWLLTRLSKLYPDAEFTAAARKGRIRAWLPKLYYPIRTGEHSQTAFAFGLILDWAEAVENEEMETLVKGTSLRFYLEDEACPLSYEPSGQDFLSPCIAEADLMRRILPPGQFANWLDDFLPGIPTDGGADWLPIGVVTDRSDGKLAHLDGLNLSRAWMLEGILAGLPDDDPRRAALQAAADTHSKSGLASVTGEHYEGGHWLGSFATYLVTQKGQ
ncbi:MAG: DUF2891 domain-containing protein [Acidobacteria bacterium]|nr:DUF2891 domain-containing protein [Candidatus Sulfomarinibacter kjeldsenii]